MFGTGVSGYYLTKINMSTITDIFSSQSARDSAKPAGSNGGLVVFRSDTSAVEVSDGTDYQTYNSDGIYQTYPSNSYSAVFGGSDYITIGTQSELNSSSSYSFCTWFKLDTASPNLESFYGGGTSTSNRNWAQVVNSTTFRIGSNGTITDVASGLTFGTSNWYHFCFSVDSGTGTAYLNGNAIGSTFSQGTSGSSAFSSNRVGALNGTGFNGNSLPFEGHLDETAFFAYALSSAQVSAIYNNKTFNNPLALYRFENNTNDTVGNYNGTNSGGVTFDSSDKPY